jgi:hypothetical protein
MAQVKSLARQQRKQSIATPAANGNLRTTILIPESIHILGVELAKKQRRSFSNFLVTLIERDAAGKSPEQIDLPLVSNGRDNGR